MKKQKYVIIISGIVIIVFAFLSMMWLGSMKDSSNNSLTDCKATAGTGMIFPARLKVDLVMVPPHGPVDLPCQLSVLDIVSRDKSAHTEFATTDARDDFILDNDRRVRIGFTLFRIAIFDAPDFFACLGV